MTEYNAMVDGAHVPALGPMVHTEYVDNFVCLSQDHAAAEKAAVYVEKELHKVGLPTQEVTCFTGGETLG